MADWKKLILLGDSNTQYAFGRSGWASSIADLLQRKCDVINRGFSGYNTTNIRAILPDIFNEFKPELICGVVIMLGSNDSTKPENVKQHVPLDTYKQNLAYIIDYLISYGVDQQKLVMISPPRINEREWLNTQPDGTHYDHLVLEYAQCFMAVARDKQIRSLDFNRLMHEYGDEKYAELLYDGLHLSDMGGKLLFDNLLPVLDEHIIANLEFNFHYWRDLK